MQKAVGWALRNPSAFISRVVDNLAYLGSTSGWLILVLSMVGALIARCMEVELRSIIDGGEYRLYRLKAASP